MELTIQESRNGKGIFATRDFAPEERLYEVTGTFITGDEDEEIDDAARANAFRYSRDFYISPAGTMGDFQNHSCEPNAKVIKKDDQLFVAAIIPIRKGEEILIDYSTITGADDVWEMECNCGGARCRGIVRSFDTLPADLKKKYLARGVVPEYVAAL